jgi:ATP-dependent Clp endopeptidase proteolytic subunit ClpP
MQKWYDIKAQSDITEILIYGDIGESWWDDGSTTAKSFVDELSAISSSEIVIRINSFGGSVSDGLAIYNAIKRHKAKITVAIDGVAISCASLIAMAGQTVEMAANALMMVHAPWQYAIGNAADLRNQADVLDKFSQAMASSYAGKTGKTAETVISDLLDGPDHWFTAEEALAEGLVDIVTPAMQIAASADFKSVSRFMPQQHAENPNLVAALSLYTQVKQDNPVTAGTLSNVDHRTNVMNKDKTSNPAENPGAEIVDIDKVRAEVRKEVLAQDGARRDSIKALFKPVFMSLPGVSDLMAQCLDSQEMTVQAASDKLMQKLGEGMEPSAKNIHRVESGETELDKFNVAAAQTLSVRAGLADKEVQAKDRQNNFRGYSLVEMARASLQMAGVNTGGMDKRGVVAAAFTHSTSDFTNLLANVAEKSMLKGYDEAEETFQRWTSRGTASDFKAMRRVDLNAFPSLDKVAEGAEYKYGTVGDRGETVQLATYGKMFSISRQAIINDDLNAFTTIPRRMGRAAIRTVGDLVYAVLTSNPTLSDSVALFHATHANLLTAATINTASVDAMIAAMAKQKDASNNAVALNIAMSYLIVPYALRGTASVVANSEYEVGAANKNNTVPNSVRGLFEVIADARLDANSAAAWYGSANPGMHDTVEVTYLDGQDQPYLETKDGWDVDGAEFKVRIDAAVSPLDFRTLARNAGL